MIPANIEAKMSVHYPDEVQKLRELIPEIVNWTDEAISAWYSGWSEINWCASWLGVGNLGVSEIAELRANTNWKHCQTCTCTS